jgi:hypothetical protein
MGHAMNAWKSSRRLSSSSRKLGSLLLGLAALTTGCGETTLDPEPPGAGSLGQLEAGLADGVTVYEHGFAGGRSATFGAGTVDFYVLSALVGNDTVSAVTVPPGWKVTLYRDAYLAGPSLVLTQSTELWRDIPGFNDVASSLKVERVMPGRNVIQHFFPSSIRFADTENCAAPASESGTTGVALYHAMPHPLNAARAMVNFGLVFKQDCGLAGHEGWGGSYGGGHHPGDIEFFSYTLKPDSSCAIGWRLHAVKTVAHSGDYVSRDITERVLDSCSPPDAIYSSLGKHALYVSKGDCSKGGEVCGDKSMGFKLYASGNSAAEAPEFWNMMSVSQYQDRVWKSAGDGRFCGGQNISNRSDCISAETGEKLSQLGTSSRSDKAYHLPDPDLGTLSPPCPSGLEAMDGLCYPRCDPGYSRIADRCYINCPSPYSTVAFHCGKPTTYGRGAGYAIWDKSKCESAHGSGNCEQCLAMYYPKCAPGYREAGCNLCEWDGGCPSGTVDVGAMCQRSSYSTGVGGPQ